MSLLGTFAFYFGEQSEPETYPYRTASGGMPTGLVYECRGGERLDQIAWAAYGIQAGAVEAILVVNPGLADLAYELPAYLAIELPDLLVETSAGTTTTTIQSEVDLWS